MTSQRQLRKAVKMKFPQIDQSNLPEPRSNRTTLIAIVCGFLLAAFCLGMILAAHYAPMIKAVPK